MSKLYVVTHVENNKSLAGIPHPHAIANIQGSALFCFRKPRPAFKVAKAIDERITNDLRPVFCEELIEPFSNLIRGQILELKYYDDIDSSVELNNVIVGRVDENELSNYCSAMNISAAVLDEWTSNDNVLYVQDIISPARSAVYSAAYLEYLFNMEDETMDADDEEEVRD